MANSVDGYKTPSLATDAIVTRNSGRSILLIVRGNEPFKGKYALPGGYIDYGEDPKEACLRELMEECSIKGDPNT